MTIANYETIIANAQRRAVLSGDNVAVPAIVDLAATSASMMGKIEFDTWEAADDARVVDDIVGEAVRNVGAELPNHDWANELLKLIESGHQIAIDPLMSAEDTISKMELSEPILTGAGEIVGKTDAAALSSAIQFALEYWYKVGKIRKYENLYASL